MANTLPEIYFYIPQEDWPSSELPKSADIYWAKFEGNFTSGVYAWTLQTYLRLKEDGFPCQLTGTLPSEGIVLAHRCSLPFYLQPNPKLLIVCLKADYEQHPYAQLHVVLNAKETKKIRRSYYIPHWPQPGLIPRSSNRGSRFENIAYLGIEKNLAPELQEPAFQAELNALGLQWCIVNDRERWNDFSEVDAILAVRSFTGEEYTHKPASKLYNAWNARVPAILGCESAYRTQRQSNLDYIEVASINETISALKHLQDRPDLRKAMVENGIVRFQEICPEKLVQKWRKLFAEIIVPEYINWCKKSNLAREIYLAICEIEKKEKYLKPRYYHDQKMQEQFCSTSEQIVLIVKLLRRIRRKLNKLTAKK